MMKYFKSVIFIVLGILILMGGIKGTSGFIPDEARIVFGIITIIYGIWKFFEKSSEKGEGKEE